MTRQPRSAFPTNHALRRRRGQRHLAQFFQAEVEGVDLDAREVRSDVGSFSYDYLILAPGSRTAYFGASGARENAIDLKGLRDALRVRNTIRTRGRWVAWRPRTSENSSSTYFVNKGKRKGRGV